MPVLGRVWGTKSLQFALVLVTLAACVPPPSPPPQPPVQGTAAPPVLSSLAAFATVRAFDPATRQVVLETPGGSIIDMTAAPQVRRLGPIRQGARVVVEYDADGVVRIAPVARLTAAQTGGRTRATVRGVAVGGNNLILTMPDGTEQEVALQYPSMMAFATRLRPGDEVAVSFAPGG